MCCRSLLPRQIIYSGRSMRSNHSTWDPRRPLYEELKAPPVPRRHYHGSDECYHTHPHPHPAGIFVFWFLISFCFINLFANWLIDFSFFFIWNFRRNITFSALSLSLSSHFTTMRLYPVVGRRWEIINSSITLNYHQCDTSFVKPIPIYFVVIGYRSATRI